VRREVARRVCAWDGGDQALKELNPCPMASSELLFPSVDNDGAVNLPDSLPPPPYLSSVV